MKLNWMGENRELIRTLIYYANMTTHGEYITMTPADGVELTKYEYQVLEYICEFENEHRNMTTIASDLGLRQSSLTNITKRLLEFGLIERFRIVGNRKTIILKPTEHGKRVYNTIVQRDIEPLFNRFMQYMNSLPDGSIEHFEKAVKILCEDWSDFSSSVIQEKKLLEKID